MPDAMGTTRLARSTPRSPAALSVAGFAFVLGFGGDGVPAASFVITGGVEITIFSVLLSTAGFQRWRLLVRAGSLPLEPRLGPLTLSRSRLTVDQVEGE